MKNPKLVLALSALLTLGLVSCGASGSAETVFVPTQSEPAEENEYLRIYNLYKAAGGEQTYEEWKASIRGERGADGASLRTGMGAPATSLGNDGDSYLDINTWDYYIKTAGFWTKIGNVQGLRGEKGDPGEKGDKGDQGEPGEKGDKGDPGEKGDKGDQGDPGEKGDKGDKGDQGDPGEKGDKGDKGDTGEKGDKGDTGDKGDKGDPGEKGDKGDQGDPGEKGDKGDKGDQGDPGEKGDKGDQGDPGEKGDKGDKGDQGDPGEKGDKGDQGDPGEKGDKGDKGQDGTSVRTGHGEPDAELGAEGDSYIDLDTWDFYVKVDGDWVLAGNIKGEQGSGAGDQGPKGDKGDQGEPGEKGQDGTSMRTGNGEPDAELGADGDSYIDLNNWNFYVKADGVWTLVGNIKGDAGGSESPVVQDKYTLTFDMNGGVGSVVSMEVEAGAIPGSLPVLENRENGARFLGWYTGFGPNDAHITNFTPIHSDMTLHAEWSFYEYNFWNIDGSLLTGYRLGAGAVWNDYLGSLPTAEPFYIGTMKYNYGGWFSKGVREGGVSGDERTSPIHKDIQWVPGFYSEDGTQMAITLHEGFLHDDYTDLMQEEMAAYAAEEKEWDNPYCFIEMGTGNAWFYDAEGWHVEAISNESIEPELPTVEIIHEGTQEDPLNANEAISIIRNWKVEGTFLNIGDLYHVEGVVTNAVYKPVYGAYDITLKNSLDTEFKFFNIKLNESLPDYSAEPEKLIGATVAGMGFLEQYVGEDGVIIYEMPNISAADSPTGTALFPTLYSIEGAEAPSAWEPGHGYLESDPFVVPEALEVAGALEVGKVDAHPCYVHGIVTSIETPYDEVKGTISFRLGLELESENTLLIYSLHVSAEDAAKILPGAEVFLTANLQNYNGVLETAGGSLVAITAETPIVAPDPVNVTVAELLALEDTVTNQCFRVSGIFEQKKNDVYGNGFLTDPETGLSIKVYGSTATASALSYAYPDFAFNNPEDAQTSLVNLENGMQVTMEVVFKMYNGTPEIMGVVTDMSSSDNLYEAEIQVGEGGTANLSKTGDIAYGEEITVTVTPNEGKVIKSVVVRDASGTVTRITDTLTFNATCVNQVIVEFEDAEGGVAHTGASLEDALTTDEAAEIMNSWGVSATAVGDTELYVSGKVVSANYDSGHSSYNIYLECTYGTFQLYSVKMPAEVGDYSANPSALVGATVAVYGYLEYYVNKSGAVTYEVGYLNASLSPTGSAYNANVVQIVLPE